MPEPTLSETEPQQTVLVYKIAGKPSEVDVFQLSKVLEAIGTVVREAYKVTGAPAGSEMEVRVGPFDRGSFVMDLPMLIHQHPGLFTLSTPAVCLAVTRTLHALGLISDETYEKIEGVTDNLIDLVKRLGGNKPKKIAQKGPNQYEFHGDNGVIVGASSTVRDLYVNPIIHKNFYQVVVPASNEETPRLETFLKGAPKTMVKIDKRTAEAIERYSTPQPSDDEVNENVAIRILHPKSGSYGRTTGTYLFREAGRQGKIRAKISDEAFLSRFGVGDIRFNEHDRLKVKLRERQIVSPTKTKWEYEILKVLDYTVYQPVKDKSLWED